MVHSLSMAGPPPPQRFTVPLMMSLRPAESVAGEPAPDPLRVVAQNISETGVRLTTEARPQVGLHADLEFVWGEEMVSCRVRVVRHCEDGVAVTFVAPSDNFNRSVREAIADAAPAAGHGPGSIPPSD